MAELEYRFNISVRVLTDVIWYAAQLSIFEVIFLYTKQLNGWTLEQSRVFMGVLFITDCFYMFFFSENLDRLGEKVRRGDLDLLLTKPIDSQWMLSFQKVSVAYLGNLVISAGWLAYSLSCTDFDPWRGLLLFIVVPTGLLTVYSIRFMTASAALFFTRADSITYIWYQVYRLGTRPDTVYPKALRYAVISIVPIGFLASVPTRIILGTAPLVMVPVSVGVSIIFFTLSRKIWKTGLRRYSSASS